MKKKTQISAENIESVLYKVNKPGRYIGGEINTISNRINECYISIALCYPDVYEIGMSNLAIKILYDIVNSQEGMVAERVFSPWLDMERELRKNKIPYYSLESKTILKNFDIIGFSIGYELLFTNILTILDLSDIPLKSKDRKDLDPLIIAGGPGVVNPEPVSEFIDAFVIGEGETILVELMNIVKDCKEKGVNRAGILKQLTEFECIYVPSLYNTEKDNSIKRFRHASLEMLSSPTKTPIPNIKPIQDRGVIEVSRGCSNGCRFCQAGYTNRPVRERRVSSIVNYVDKLIHESGYKDITLMSLSVADYSGFPALLNNLFECYQDAGISFSLPSIRIDSFDFDVAVRIAEVKKFGLTFAVEAGNDYMRRVINKKYTEEKLLDFIEKASKHGWNTIKLYFMIGLPVETGDMKEEEAITELLNGIAEKTSRRTQINAHIGIFIPKAHTAFQWVGMISTEQAFNKITYIKRHVKHRRIKVKYVEPNLSVLEGLLSLGDNSLSSVILDAYKNGARFDGWQECFNLELWLEACRKNNINIDRILYLDKPEDYVFPWDNIDVKIDRDYLYKEFEKAGRAEITDHCLEKCHDYCGSCDKNIKRDFDKSEPENIKLPDSDNVKTPDYLKRTAIGKIRVIYEKKKLAKFIGHLDFMYLIQKILIIIDAPVVYSKGFSPSPKLEFTPPLSNGFEADNDLFEFKVYEEIDTDEFIEKLNHYTIDGIKFKKAVFINDNKSLNKKIKSFEYVINFDSEKQKELFLKELINIMSKEYIIADNNKKKYNAINKYEELDNGNAVSIVIKNVETAQISILDILKYTLGINRDELSGLSITRNRIFLYGVRTK